MFCCGARNPGTVPSGVQLGSARSYLTLSTLATVLQSRDGHPHHRLTMPLQPGSLFLRWERWPVRRPAGSLAGSAAPGSRCRSAPPAGAAARRSAESLAGEQAEDAGRPGRRGRCAAGHDAVAGPGRGAAGTPLPRHWVRPGPVRAPGRAQRRPGRRARSSPARKPRRARSASGRELADQDWFERRRRGTRVVLRQPQCCRGDAYLAVFAALLAEPRRVPAWRGRFRRGAPGHAAVPVSRTPDIGRKLL
jgi:hypothetical protein